MQEKHLWPNSTPICSTKPQQTRDRRARPQPDKGHRRRPSTGRPWRSRAEHVPKFTAGRGHPLPPLTLHTRVSKWCRGTGSVECGSGRKMLLPLADRVCYRRQEAHKQPLGKGTRTINWALAWTRKRQAMFKNQMYLFLHATTTEN